MQHKYDFTGKTVLITGGSSGIGESLAKEFCRAGAKRIIIAARRVNELERVKSECCRPEAVEIWQIDLNNPRECLESAQKLELDQLDILVNNGGVSQRQIFEKMDFESIETLIATNTTSPIALIKGFLPELDKTPGATIVNISSVAGYFAPAVRTVYGASKFALAGFGKALRSEVKGKDTNVLNVYPGYVRTGVSKNALTGNKDERLGKTDANIQNGMPSDEAARKICTAISMKYTEFILADQTIQQLLPYLQLNGKIEEFLGVTNFKSQLKAINDAS